MGKYTFFLDFFEIDFKFYLSKTFVKDIWRVHYSLRKQCERSWIRVRKILNETYVQEALGSMCVNIHSKQFDNFPFYLTIKHLSLQWNWLRISANTSYSKCKPITNKNDKNNLSKNAIYRFRSLKLGLF